MSVTNNRPMPWHCRWIQPSERAVNVGDVRVSNWTRALCVRLPKSPRYVTRQECARCAFWEPAVSPAY
jgi:hypothetical protein